MPSLSLKAVVGPRSASYPALAALCSALAPDALSILDQDNKLLLGATADESPSSPTRVPISLDEETLGFVLGPAPAAGTVALLVSHLAAREREARALAAEVLHLYREVHLIEQLSEQLAAILDLDAVSETALAQAKRLIPATHGCILVQNKAADTLRPSASFGPSTADGVGPLAPASQFVRSILERGIAEIVNDCHNDARALESERTLNALICAPLRAGQRSVGVIALANANPGASYSTADLKLLNTIALQTASALENSFLAAEMVAAVRDREKLAALQQELDTARTIQHLLVPGSSPFPERTEFDLHAQMTSARAVGGDFFDFFLLDDDHIGVVIGDVSGKGIPAALYMALTRMQVKTTAIQGMSPAACFLDVNRVLVRERVSAMFATCFYGLLNLRTGELRYCSAGHNPPYLLRANGRLVEPLSEVGGIPLGLFDGMGYLDSIAHLHPGDALFLYTDGVPEAQSVADEDFSNDRVIATLSHTSAATCRELIADMTRQVTEFTDGAPQFDDITMLCLRRL